MAAGTVEDGADTVMDGDDVSLNTFLTEYLE